MTYRFATPADSAALLRIYDQYIGTTVTFEYVLPTEAEFARRIEDVLEVYPYLVCLDGDRIVGYGYAHRIWERAAYQWDAELSVYLDRAYTGRGLGRNILNMLMDLLRLQGVKTAYSVVTLPNPPSEKLHAAMGFRRLAAFPNSGYKTAAGWAPAGTICP